MPDEFDYQAAVQQHEKDLHDEEQKLESMKLQCKAQADVIKAKGNRLRLLMRHGEAAIKEQGNLFDDPKKKSKTNGKAGSPSTAAQNPADPAPVDPNAPKDDSWKQLPITDAIKVGAVVRCLEEQKSLTQMGPIAIWLNTDFEARQKGFAALTGIGEQKASLAADQWAEWWKANPQFCRE